MNTVIIIMNEIVGQSLLLKHISLYIGLPEIDLQLNSYILVLFRLLTLILLQRARSSESEHRSIATMPTTVPID